MYTINYDGSFHGFLTVVFDHFTHPEIPAYILTFDKEQHRLFPSDTFIETNREKALRVWKGIERKNPATAKAIPIRRMPESVAHHVARRIRTGFVRG